MKAILSLTLIVGMIASSASALQLPRKQKPTGVCVFGDSIDQLEMDKRFEVQADVIKTFKMWRSVGDSLGGEGAKPPMVAVSIVKDTKTGKVYHMNTTFRHVDDGDNTVGWIEEVNDAEKRDSGYEGEGRVVATIGDSEIESCLVRE